MYETERLILSVTLLVVLVSWDKDNLPITIVIITGLIFNIVSVIYKSIVYKQNDKKNIIMVVFRTIEQPKAIRNIRV